MGLNLAALAGGGGAPGAGVSSEDVLRVASGGIGGLGSLEALGYSTGSKLAERLRAAQVRCYTCRCSAMFYVNISVSAP